MPIEIQYSEKAEILDLTPYPKKILNVEFEIFGNKEITGKNRRIYKRDEHGLILLNQTQYDMINIELSIFGERKTFWESPIRKGTVEVCPDNERIYHYSITAKNTNLSMSITICDQLTQVHLAFYESTGSQWRFRYTFTGIDRKGYLDFNPYFTSILSKIPIAKNFHKMKSIPTQKKEEYERQLINQNANEITGPDLYTKKFLDKIHEGKKSEKLREFIQMVEQKSKERKCLSDKSEAYLKNGLQKYLDGDVEGAESDFHQTLKFNPEMYHAKDYLGLIAMNLRKDYPKAERMFLNALKSKHNKKETYYFLGMLMMAQERYIEAENYFTLAMKARLNICNAWNGMGNVLLYQGHLLEASIYFIHAVDFFHKRRQARNSLEELVLRANEKYFKINPPEDSLNDIKAVLLRDPLRANVRDKPLYRQKINKQDNPELWLLDEIKRMSQITFQIKVGDILKLYNMSISILEENLKRWEFLEGYRVINDDFVIENPVLFINSLEFQKENIHKSDALKIERERAEMLLRSNQCKRCSKHGVPYHVSMISQRGDVMHSLCICNFCDNCINQVRLDHPRNIYRNPGTSDQDFQKQIQEKIRSLKEN
ncbi:tetratricopeptide repeat protein [Promethearchaeum syntrophicum]|uniref:Tetratricopeptide repeat protein n=1 Tax=Promethearchaeum syntrophicum TaxID=2594042 RepID=A0A5B9DAL6_9ARCH|nr:hypothetical protein [Candidatus Prometheoarchaeum syntrophicum]QEE16173.1 Tetratricopeptide repeat protein [Candidatus Prometheoarchaeum syntrophicum]